MIEGQLVDCSNELIVGNLTVSPIDREIAVQVSTLIGVSKNPLCYSIRYA